MIATDSPVECCCCCISIPLTRFNNVKKSSDTVSLAAFLASNELLRRIPILLIVVSIDVMHSKTHDVHDDVFLDLDDHAATGSVVAAVATVVVMAAPAPAVGVLGLFATSERIADPQPHPAVRPASAVSIPLLLRRSGVVMAVF